MQRNLVFLVFGVALFALSACDSKNSPVPTGQQGSAQDSPEWTISFQSSCLSGSEVYCLGQYGFSIDASGQFIVGPGPAGQIRKGTISESALKMISELIGSTAATETCLPADRLESHDQLSIHRKTNQSTLLKTDDKGFCHILSSGEKAEALHNAIRDLADTHYPLPFPDSCAESAEAVEALYPSFQRCSLDTDCGYFTPAFEIIPPGTIQYVVTDDCSRISPLVVANIGAVINGQTRIVSALETAQGICGQRMIRNDCTGISGFHSTDGAPVCIQNTCQVPAGVLN